MLNVPLDTQQVILWTVFPVNLVASSKKSEKPGEAKYKI